ncbi:MAG: tetratricopeptide repeat protein [Bdellovibrionia bacterium]
MKQLCIYSVMIGLSLSLMPLTSSHAATPRQQQALLQELTGKKPSQLKERDLYADILTAYDTKDLMRLQTKTQQLVRYFPQGSLAPKALYMQSLLQAEKKRYVEALKSIAKIEKSYPQSSRRVSATFLKAMIFKSIHLPQQSATVLREVSKKFPGSPESYRAAAELKILQNKVN